MAKVQIEEVRVRLSDGREHVYRPKGEWNVTVEDTLDWSHLSASELKRFPRGHPPMEMMKKRFEIEGEGEYEMTIRPWPLREVELAPCHACGAPQGVLQVPQ